MLWLPGWKLFLPGWKLSVGCPAISFQSASCSYLYHNHMLFICFMFFLGGGGQGSTSNTACKVAQDNNCHTEESCQV